MTAVDGRWAAWDTPPTPEAPPPHTEMADLPAFVTWLTSTWRRDILDGRGRTFCPDWWKHPEAVDVLDALWRVWEQLRLPEHAAFGPATFWRDWAYPLLPELTAEDGPFAGCSPTGGHSPAAGPVTLTPPPPGLFTDVDAG